MGDMVGYGPQPNAVVERLREYELSTILGNHDLAVIEKLDLGDFNQDAVDANVWTRFQLSDENRAWLEGLCQGEYMGAYAEINDKVTLAHGSPAEPIWQYLTTPYAASYSFPRFNTPLCFIGHTHLPRIFRMAQASPVLEALQQSEEIPAKEKKALKKQAKIDMRIPEAGYVLEVGEDRIILNPGSVGQPRDGDPRAAYALFDDQAMTITFGRVAYDISVTQALMHEYKLPSRLSLRLDYGL
jgi:diadenosine tetraphosphatase ApaH/serine/threonine PP2A family protein phosphatase